MNSNTCIKVLLLVGAISCVSVEGRSVASGECRVKWSDPLPSWYPLVFNESGIIYPRRTGNNSDWSLVLKRSSKIKVGCPSGAKSQNNLMSYDDQDEVVVQCSSKGLTIDKKPANFSDLGCAERFTEKLVLTGTCYNGASKIEILFESGPTVLPLITLCHDDNIDETYYAHHYIIGAALNTYETSNNRPSFTKAQFYSLFSTNEAYKQANQLTRVGELVGSKTLAKEYINPKKQFYFARGHLAPDGDFVHIYQQNATYYYINVMPQWQSINNGNWKAMEGAVRKYAAERNVDLEVWTGGKGVLKLEDLNGNPVEIYLAQDKSGNPRLPAPELTWKLLRDPIRKASVAAFTVNNPHLSEVPPELKVCSDVTSKISWVSSLNWKVENIEKGFTYFCRVEDVMDVLPLDEITLLELSKLDLLD